MEVDMNLPTCQIQADEPKKFLETPTQSSEFLFCQSIGAIFLLRILNLIPKMRNFETPTIPLHRSIS